MSGRANPGRGCHFPTTIAIVIPQPCGRSSNTSTRSIALTSHKSSTASTLPALVALLGSSLGQRRPSPRSVRSQCQATVAIVPHPRARSSTASLARQLGWTSCYGRDPSRPPVAWDTLLDRQTDVRIRGQPRVPLPIPCTSKSLPISSGPGSPESGLIILARLISLAALTLATVQSETHLLGRHDGR